MAVSKRQGRAYRKQRIRKNIFGTPEKPRLSVFKSLRYVYAQLIDDLNGKTLVSANSLDLKKKSGNKEAAIEVGKLIATKAKDIKVSEVAFDRNGFLYHGVIKEMADSARKEGLKF